MNKTSKSMKVLDLIPRMDDNRIFGLFQNAVRLLGTDKDSDAKMVLERIGLEWKKRKEAYLRGTYKPAFPKKGMLATFGYHVGETEGVKKKYRQEILNQIMTLDLPIVQSPAYTAEWHEKNSCSRLKKISNSLSAFIYDAQHGYKANLNFDMAVMDWSDDLDFMKENFYNKMNCKYKWPEIEIKD
ncbi:MAG: hypothetical protein QGG87_02140 [Nitrospinota bacterium]|nr:hypothetical protein [Nitrospinota bacterium]|tara:strand:+ start:631 stop:1185 length:555 start_codon:yes stop_codon:yes gene_type:complete